MPRVPGEEGKKKEPPAYMGDPNATRYSYAAALPRQSPDGWISFAVWLWELGTN